jgi:hypothetical protein
MICNFIEERYHVIIINSAIPIEIEKTNRLIISDPPDIEEQKN